MTRYRLSVWLAASDGRVWTLSMFLTAADLGQSANAASIRSSRSFMFFPEKLSPVWDTRPSSRSTSTIISSPVSMFVSLRLPANSASLSFHSFLINAIRLYLSLPRRISRRNN